MVTKKIDIRYRRISFSGFRLLGLVFLSLAFSGCAILPVPTSVESLPFNDEELSGIVPGETSRPAVTDLLGEPGFEDSGSTIALYVDRRRVAGVVGAAGNSAGFRPVHTKHILVISYDESDTVRFVDVFRQGLVNGRSEICASSGICINLRIGQSEDVFRIVDATFYDVPENDADAKRSDAPSDQCAVYVYLDTNFWASETVSIHTVGHAGSMVRLDESGYVLWLYDPSPVKIGGSAPNAAQGSSDIKLDCVADQAYFVKAKLRWNWGAAGNDLLFLVERLDRGKAAIRKRRLILGGT